MKYLFVHQNFPAQFLHLLRHLVAQKKHDLLFLTENSRNKMAGVRSVLHGIPKAPTPDIHRDSREFELAMLRAEGVAIAAEKLKGLGFTPDIIIGHHGWGELLNFSDVFPDTPLLGYHEFYYRPEGFDVNFDPEFPVGTDMMSRVRAKNAINLLALTNPGYGHTPTAFQHSTYPDWAQGKMEVLHEGVNLQSVKPNAELRKRTVTLGGYRIKPADKLVTYVVRDLEPYRGFHIMMRTLPHLLAARPDVHVVLVGGDATSYGARPDRGTWREKMLDELSGKLDMDRVHFPGRVPYETYLKLLQRSDAHVYLTYPFVASWSLREALAAGCAVVASDTAPVREFVTHRKNGLLAPFLQPEKVADAVLEVLENATLNTRLRKAARVWAERNLDMDTYIKGYEALIKRTMKLG